MKVRIKNIEITGLRGIKETLKLPLNEKSVLIYGDNGTGKSSISDSLEWYYTDGVEHLSIEGIELKDALRNSLLSNEEISSIKVGLNRTSLDNERTLFYKREKLVSEFLNTTDECKAYLNNSANENILLRYQFLRNFIDQTKSDKLRSLSDIIGYSEITKIKDVLKKGFNSIKTELRNQNFEAQINTQKRTLIEKIGAAVSVERNFIDEINKIIAPLNTGISVATLEDVDKVLNHIKTPSNNPLISELKFLETSSSVLSTLQREATFIDGEYQKFCREFDLIAQDVNSIMQTYLADLLNAGNSVLNKGYHKEATCPLCLQPKAIEELTTELQKRLKEIEDSSKKKQSFDSAKQTVFAIGSERILRLNGINDPLLKEASNDEIRNGIENLKIKISEYQKASAIKVTSGSKPPVASQLILNEGDFLFLKNISGRINKINEALKANNNAVLYAKVLSAKDAFLNIKKFEAGKEKLERQQNSFKLIYDEFVKRQKEGLEDFISKFSGRINELYQYMNPGEQFDEIKIVTIGEEDELNGITIQYKYNGSWVSPPQKYFSESHLNCFGISFFLASVEAYNKVNKFIVLDDIISSFDTTHRKKFADLIFDKFSDYQIILLTHEYEWFQYVSQLAKRKHWLISEVKWSDTNGTHIEPKATELKELIEENLAKSNGSILGNPLRQYLEHILKDISANVDVKVNFRFNEVNEKRMVDELLNALKAKINKSSELKAKMPVIDAVVNSNILGNLLSHNNSFSPKIGDLKAFWADILNLESLFYCQSCNKPIAMKNYDTITNRIRCGCGILSYDWKK